MKNRQDQNGFSLFRLVIILITVGCLELVVYSVYIHQQNKQDAKGNFSLKQKVNEEQSATAADVSSSPAVETTEDLDEAVKVLDRNDPSVSNNDARQLDIQASNF